MHALLSPPCPAVKPVGSRPYFDKIAVWLVDPLDKGTIAALRADCGHLHVGKSRARFDGRYRCRLELKQPGDAALRMIADQPAVLINSAEPALDLVFADRNERDDAADFLHRHAVRRWHPRKASIYTHAGAARTRYDARRGARNMLVAYTEAFCRVTGECCNLHLEWRANGVAAVQKLGIESGADLRDFDHRAFWTKRLLLVAIEPAHIGRYLRNRRNGSRSRAYDDNDDRDGQIVLDSVDTLQELLDRYGDRWRLGTLLQPLPNSHYLPAAHSLL